MKTLVLIALLFSIPSFASAEICRLSKDTVEDMVRADIEANITQALRNINPQVQVEIDKYKVDVDIDFDIDDPQYGEIKVDEIVVKLDFPSAPTQTLVVRSQKDKKAGDDKLELEDEDKFKIFLFETYGEFGEVTSCLLSSQDPYFYLINKSTNQRVQVSTDILLWNSTLAESR